ncbi:8-oxo-dGTP diphosphatase [Bacillus sp. JJ1521]|uniref:NUDIX hydrolase n=1 Tax=Bacillus sp. JJ1521 TaxID=3122957 RepID=UPI0030004A56
MYSYTICFIKQGNKILLLNRESPEWMGIWNGVGGKLEEGETPLECVIREIREETGIEMKLENVWHKGNISWTNPTHSYFDGMYAFIAELPAGYEYHTPLKTDEGILDWKDLTWVLHPKNVGIANLKYFLNEILYEETNYEHRFVYDGDEVVDFSQVPLVEPVQH